jgi:hypothetical protein
MRNIVVKKFVAASIIAAVVCTASTFTAKAALDLTVSDTAPAETAPVAPAVPASDFNGTSAAPAAVVSNPAVVVPEPGTMFAGLGVLTYFLLKSGRRSRA